MPNPRIGAGHQGGRDLFLPHVLVIIGFGLAATAICALLLPVAALGALTVISLDLISRRFGSR